MLGIDISQHNGSINWDVLKNSVDFVILRIGWTGNKNNHTLDTKFNQYYNEATRVGIPVGCYVYLYNNNETSAKDGAKWALKQLEGKEIQMPIYADMEDKSIAGLGRAKLTAITKAFNAVIEANGYKAGVYANANWFNNYLDKSIQSRYTCWIAHYTKGKDKYKGQFDMWQNSSDGNTYGDTNPNIEGIKGRVDTNYLYNESLVNSETTPIKPKPEKPTRKFDYVTYSNGSTPEKVYETSRLKKAIGLLNPGEKCRAYGQKHNNTIVAYQVDGKNFVKAGFTDYSGKIKRVPVQRNVWQNGSTTEKVYRESTLKTQIGSLKPYEKCYVIDQFKSGAYLVLYKIDYKDEYKIGFVKYHG